LRADASNASVEGVGPYLSERQWARCARTTAPAAPPGIFPHDHAAAAPIDGEDGIAGVSDDEQRSAVARPLERPRLDLEGAAVRLTNRRAITARTQGRVFLLDAAPRIRISRCSTSTRSGRSLRDLVMENGARHESAGVRARHGVFAAIVISTSSSSTPRRTGRHLDASHRVERDRIPARHTAMVTNT